MNNEETQVATEPAIEETQVDMSEITITHNGEVIDTTTPEEEAEAPKEEAADEPSEDTNKQAEGAKAEQAEAKTTLAEKGIDYDKLEEEYLNGGLTEASYKQLEEAGYPKAVVDAIVAGWQAKADAFYNDVVASVGGKDQYEQVTKFVQSQGADAVQAFNNIVSTADLNTVKAYLAGVQAQREAKFGTANPSLVGRANGGNVNNAFSSTEDMVKAMSDKRYGRDAKYTAEVERKIAVSNIFN